LQDAIKAGEYAKLVSGRGGATATRLIVGLGNRYSIMAY